MPLVFDSDTTDQVIREAIEILVGDAARSGGLINAHQEAVALRERFPALYATDELAEMIIRACTHAPGVAVEMGWDGVDGKAPHKAGQPDGATKSDGAADSAPSTDEPAKL